MDYFTYPLNTKVLLRKKIAIRKELLQQDIIWMEKRVAVLGGSTTKEIVDQLELALLYYGIKAEFYQSEYGQYWEDGMFENKELDIFKPSIIYIHTNWRNIHAFPSIKDTKEDVERMLEIEYNHYAALWDSLKEKYKCPIIQNNFERPNYRLMGNRDIWDYRGRSNFIARLNQRFYEYAQGRDSFYINDIDFLAQDFGLSEWNNFVHWNMYKYACAVNAIPHLAFSVANIIKSIYGKNKKLLVLDLDNTLWGGVVGDDGIEGIKIGVETSQGQVYYEFQGYCKNLQQIGVILAVNSKNDEENALAGINHPDGVLKQDDFVAIRANWNTKDQNILEIAEELSLGIDSFVFVDDNPAEREFIAKQLPDVAVPTMDGAENYIKVLDQSGYFEVTSFSAEDIEKTNQYRARKVAGYERGTFGNYKEYLLNLEMRVVITEFESINIQRVAQLTNKSNQFNLTTLRCTEEDIKVMQESPAFICLCGRLIDKYTDNGIVSVVAGEIIGNTLHIRLWLMSCRVLKRSMEDVMMNALVAKASKQGIRQIVGYYYPTKKNKMVKDFYYNMGFAIESDDGNGNTIWKIDVSDYKMRETQIDVGEK